MPDEIEDFGSRIVFAEEARAAGCLRFRPHSRIIVRGDEHDRSVIVDRGEAVTQFQS